MMVAAAVSAVAAVVAGLSVKPARVPGQAGSPESNLNLAFCLLAAGAALMAGLVPAGAAAGMALRRTGLARLACGALGGVAGVSLAMAAMVVAGTLADRLPYALFEGVFPGILPLPFLASALFGWWVLRIGAGAASWVVAAGVTGSVVIGVWAMAP